MQTTIWHNPKCSKSKQTLALLKSKGIEPTIRLYLKSPPDAEELGQLLTMLDLAPQKLVRRGEALYKDLGLSGAADDELIAVMCEHPTLIERPVVVHGESAKLGRPPENVLSLF